MVLTWSFLRNMSVERIRNTGLPGWATLFGYYLFVTVRSSMMTILPIFSVGILTGQWDCDYD